MASYVIALSTQSNDIADWVPIPLTVEDAAYCMANGGHMAFDISGFSPTESQSYTIAIAWADCDESANNAVIGVTKYQSIAIQSGVIDTGKNTFVIETSTPSDRFIETYGLGPVIDARTNPVTTPKRIAFVGLINRFGNDVPVTLILTPTKIV